MKNLLAIISLTFVTAAIGTEPTPLQTRLFRVPEKVVQAQAIRTNGTKTTKPDSVLVRETLEDYGLVLPPGSKITYDSGYLIVTSTPWIHDQIRMIYLGFFDLPNHSRIRLKSLILSEIQMSKFSETMKNDRSSVILSDSSSEFLDKLLHNNNAILLEDSQILAMGGETFQLHLSIPSPSIDSKKDLIDLFFEGKPSETSEHSIALKYTLKLLSNTITQPSNLQQISTLTLPNGKSAILRSAKLNKDSTLLILIDSINQGRFSPSGEQPDPSKSEQFMKSLRKIFHLTP
jgi:hypothetical protein